MNENNRDENLNEVEEVKAEESKEETIVVETNTEVEKPGRNEAHIYQGVGLGILIMVIELVGFFSLKNVILAYYLIASAVLDLVIVVFFAAVKKKKDLGMGLLIGYSIMLIVLGLFVLLLFGACMYAFR